MRPEKFHKYTVAIITGIDPDDVDKGTPIYRLGKMVGHAAAYRMGYRKLAKKAQIEDRI